MWAAGVAHVFIMVLQEHRKNPILWLRLCVLGALLLSKSIEMTAIAVVSLCTSEKSGKGNEKSGKGLLVILCIPDNCFSSIAAY